MPVNANWRFWKKGVAGLLLVGLAGCSGMNHTEKGALTGGAIGGALGAGIGSLARAPGTGAAIGAGLGALAGASVGNDTDRAERRQERINQALRNPPLSVQDVAQLAQQRMPDDIIIRQIVTTGSAYNLSTNDLNYLYQAGVSTRVIQVMQERRVPGVGPGVVAVPAAAVQPVYVIQEPPPPSIGLGIGYTSGPRHRRW